jgi:hypothetical protein
MTSNCGKLNAHFLSSLIVERERERKRKREREVRKEFVQMLQLKQFEIWRCEAGMHA